VLAVVTAAQVAGVARPAWRLVVDHARGGLLGSTVAAVALLAAAALGWRFRDQLSASRRHQ
jgi:NSS family neurotransmitter:Na+ symporter